MAQSEPPLWLPATRTAKRHVRKMDPAANEGGGSQPQVLEDDEGTFWMTKAQNNPQGLKVLVNELVAAALGQRLGAAVQPAAVLTVPNGIASEVHHEGGTPWLPGASFASRLMDSAAPYAPDMLSAASNHVALAKAAVLDTWLGINDGRQARATRNGSKYDVRAVDFGHSLGSPNWTAADLAAKPIPVSVADPNGWVAAVSGDELEQIAADVASVSDGDIDKIVALIPEEWGVTEEERKALAAYLKDRRSVMAVLVDKLAGSAP